jgi:hypothetical protein
VISKDIVEKVKRDFESPDDAALVLSLLDDFTEQRPDLAADRILRCMVFVANGDLDLFDKALDLARIDYRDLIVWAEYDEVFVQIRDMSVPFEE